MKAFLTMTAAIALAAAPASAQLLGGGGLGGSLGGSLGGNLGGTLGGTMGGMSDGSRLGGVTDGALRGRGETAGTQSVDRKKGSVAADRSVGGSLDQTVETPRRTINAGGPGDAAGNAGVNGSAQLIGTDAVRDTVGSARSTVRETAGTARSTVRSTADYAGTATRSAAHGATSTALNGAATARGAAEASTANAVSAASNQLAIAGSAAAGATGAVAVEPGMVIRSAKGQTIGTVHDVVADSHGRVQSLVVESGDRLATLPAGSFSGNGELLFTGMSKGEIKKASKSQANEQPAS